MLEMDYEDMLEHVCGFCNKVFKKEVKLDRHIRNNHMQPSTKVIEGQEKVNISENFEMPIKEESFEVKSEPTDVTFVKPRKMSKKYDNLYGFDPVNRIWVCGSCGATYKSDHGMRCHLKTTVCGFGEKEGYKPKMNYKSLYMKEAGQLTCCGCASVYHSERGMYHHLKLTTCGFGSKEKSTPKKDFTPFYKVENNIHTCLVCGVNYDSIRGMHYHLKKKCGAEAKLKVFSPKHAVSEGQIKNPSGEKKNYKQFYRKEEDSSFTCLGCEIIYYSSRGVHRHLNTTKCGFGDKFRSPPNTCYLKLYRREGDQFICLGCAKVYSSNRGIHHHLNNTRCGFGERENGPPRNNYTPLYNKLEGLYECKRCAFKVPYVTGMHRHIKTCVAGFLQELNKLAEAEAERKEVKNEDSGFLEAFQVNDTNIVMEEFNTLAKAELNLVGIINEELVTSNDDVGGRLEKLNTMSKAEFSEILMANGKGASNICLNLTDFSLD